MHSNCRRNEITALKNQIRLLTNSNDGNHDAVESSDVGKSDGPTVSRRVSKNRNLFLMVVIVAVLSVFDTKVRLQNLNRATLKQLSSEESDPTYLRSSSPDLVSVAQNGSMKTSISTIKSYKNNALMMKTARRVNSVSAGRPNGNIRPNRQPSFQTKNFHTMINETNATKVSWRDFFDNDGGLRWNDQIFTRKGWDVDPVVIESHKLLFFTIPKNGCTEWKMLFRRMLNHSDWWSKVPHDPKSNGLRYLGQYSRSRQREMMTSPQWTRAIFVRDPLERVLSAYRDKGIGPERYLKKHCCGIIPRASEKGRREERAMVEHTKHRTCLRLLPYEAEPTATVLPFERFVKDFLNECKDLHWQPQHKRITQPENWKFVNFVGHFETLHEDARRLLDRIGAYDEFGSDGWGPFRNQSFLARNFAKHATSSHDSVEKMYTPELKRLVLEFVRGDYEHDVLNFSKPADYNELLFGFMG